MPRPPHFSPKLFAFLRELEWQEMRRVAIVGPSGAGKTALALELGRILGLPVVHLDRVFWRRGWKEPSREDWIEEHRRLLDPDAWILDGNYGSTMEERLAHADTAVFLDLPRWRCLLRVYLRALTHLGETRPDLTPGCPEHVPDREFVSWIWEFPKKHRPGVLERLEAFRARGGEVVHLRRPREVRELTARLRRARP